MRLPTMSGRIVVGQQRASRPVVALVALAMTAVAAGCGSSNATSSTTTATTAPPTTAAPTTAATTSPPTTAASAGLSSLIRTITKNWEEFFDAKTPVSRRVALLENGASFESVIKAQASSPLASAASAKVDSVTLISSKAASVKYSILVGGTPELTQTGMAVLQGGVWKVGVRSFCGLLTLEAGGKTSSLPAACR